ncbi:DUF1152 domain-containing protein [Microlunatus elymi]|uniref:DUF1152 domain-containing protein n=1 Tax=Microlunatus elymi TaxID=2596828 RepID=UPI00143D22C7|nr:DUF1152 domain-containing protein [Microlunatus elymi]
MTLYVASGGLGDLLLAAAIAETQRRWAIYAAIPWERPSVDPHVGPRALSDLKGIARDGGGYRVTGGTSALGCASQLPVIADILAPAPLYALNVAEPLSQQIEHLAEQHRADEISLVDVGGDVLANGPAPGVVSPLSEALLITALRRVRHDDKTVIVGGLGLDGELSRGQIEEFLGKLTPTRLPAIDRKVARSWHTRGRVCRTEASLLALLSVLCHPMRVQVGEPFGSAVETSEFSARNYRIQLDDLLDSGVPGSLFGPADSITTVQAKLVELGFPDELRHHAEWGSYSADGPRLSFDAYVTEPYITIRSLSRFMSGPKPTRELLARLHRSLSRRNPELSPVVDRSTARAASETVARADTCEIPAMQTD